MPRFAFRANVKKGRVGILLAAVVFAAFTLFYFTRSAIDIEDVRTRASNSPCAHAHALLILAGDGEARGSGHRGPQARSPRCAYS